MLSRCLIAVTVGAVVFGLAAPARAASFDCRKARTPDEVTICNDRDLSDRDVRMATYFEIARGFVGMGQRGAMYDDQAEWLKQRRACKTDKACLRRLYDKRIKEFKAVLDRIKSYGPF